MLFFSLQEFEKYLRLYGPTSDEVFDSSTFVDFDYIENDYFDGYGEGKDYYLYEESLPRVDHFQRRMGKFANVASAG